MTNVERESLYIMFFRAQDTRMCPQNFHNKKIIFKRLGVQPRASYNANVLGAILMSHPWDLVRGSTVDQMKQMV